MSSRPSVTFSQEFEAPVPVVGDTDLPTVLVGVSREIVFKALAVDSDGVSEFQAGNVSRAFSFPGYTGEQAIEQDDDTTIEDRLKPKVYIDHEVLGQAEITDSVTFDYDTPSITIPAALTAEFSPYSGTGATFANDTLVTGQNFPSQGASASVLASQVIEVDGVPTFLIGVNPFLSADPGTLSVTRIDKGSGTVNGVLGIANANGFRAFTSADATFLTDGVKVGDRLAVWGNGADLLDKSFGIAYAATAVADLVDADADFTTAPAVADNAGTPTTSTATFDYVSIVSGNDRTPLFYVTDPDPDLGDETKIEGTTFDGAAPTADTDAPYAINRLGAASVVATATYSAGSWTVTGDQLVATSHAAGDAVAAGDVFCDTATGAPLYVVLDHTAEANTSTVAPLYAAATAAGSGGFYRPGVGVDLFDSDGGGDNLRIVNVHNQKIDLTLTAGTAAGTSVSVAVTGNEVDGFDVVCTGKASSLVSHIVSAINALTDVGLRAYGISPSDNFDASTAATALAQTNIVRRANGGGAYTVADGAGERDLTVVGGNFTTTIGAAATTFTGDDRPIVYSSTDVPTFYVVEVVDDNTLKVVNVGATPASGASSSAFPFRIYSAEAMELEVVAVVSNTALQVKNLNTDPATGTAFTALEYRVTFPNEGTPRADNISWEIVQTLSGSLLVGDIRVSWMGRRTGVSDLKLKVMTTLAEITAAYGPAVPDNPLAMALAMSLAAAPGTSLYALGVSAETTAAYQTGLDKLKLEAVYSVVALTQNPTILAMVEAFIDAESAPEQGREKKSFVSYARVTPATKADYDADTLSVTKVSSGLTTVAITSRNITSLIAIGDKFTGTTTGGVTFIGTIVSMSGLGSLSSGSTALTLTPDSDLVVGGPTTLTDFTITEPDLTLTEEATAQAAISSGVLNRRVSNVYPASGVIEFTDTTASDDGSVPGVYADLESPSERYGTGSTSTKTADVGCHFAAAQESAKSSEIAPSQPLTGTPSPGWLALDNPFDGRNDLEDVLIDAGTHFLTFIPGTAFVTAINGLTTDNTDLRKMLESGARQIDYAVRVTRKAMRKLIGPFVKDGPWYDSVNMTFASVQAEIVSRRKIIRQWDLVEIKDDPNRADGILMTIRAAIYYPGNHIDITVSIGN